jgi:transposase
LESAIALSPEQEKKIHLLNTVLGVGRTIAIFILAEMGDIQRFYLHKALYNWVGLTPKIRSSDLFVHHGRTSKLGSPLMRAGMTRASAIAS